jgi:hypothetical protein
MHHHLSVVALVFFFVGIALHTLAQVDAIARSKNNPARSRTAILKSVWVAIVIRSAWCVAFFVLWLQGQLVNLLEVMKIPIPEIMTAVFGLHVGGGVAFMAGYASDSALAFIPKLKNSVPPPIDTVQESLASAATAIVKAGDAVADAQDTAEVKK